MDKKKHKTVSRTLRPETVFISQFGGINPCLSSWKSVETDLPISPMGFHALSKRL